MCSQIPCLHESFFLKNPHSSLCALREVHTCMYVKQCFLTRSPSRTAQSTLDPTSWSKINHTHNRDHHHPKSVARKLLSSSIILFWCYLLSARGRTHKSYLVVSRATFHLKIPDFFRASTITKCHRSLTPKTLFVASDSDLWSLSQSVPTELVKSSVKSSWSKQWIGSYHYYYAETSTTLTTIWTNI